MIDSVVVVGSLDCRTGTSTNNLLLVMHERTHIIDFASSRSSQGARERAAKDKTGSVPGTYGTMTTIPMYGTRCGTGLQSAISHALMIGM